MAEFRSQRKDPGVVARMTTIGNDVWMGQDVFVKAGVSVGDGAIVAARSVVTRDVDPYTIVAGIPARPLRSRFDEATIKRLLGVAWWRFSIFDIYDIDFRNVSAALDSIEKRLDEGSIQPFLPEKLTLASMGRILSSP
jgi:tetrahydrodipicolinate N-succinyltransferase